MYNTIINLLDLKEEQVDDIELDYNQNKLDVTIFLKRKLHSCPQCLKSSNKVKDYTIKKYSHQIINHFDTTIYYQCRRYVCPLCNKTFNESSPFGKTYHCISNTTFVHILEDLKHYSATYSQVAKKYKVSPTTVMKIFDNHVQVKRHTFPEVICIDEFYFNRHSKYKYAFMIMGFKNKLILDIVESRHQSKLSDYFFHIPIEERREVKTVCMDMYIFYKQLMQLYFPNSIICIDSFHVIKKVTDSLNSVRKRICRRYNDNKDSKEYKLLKYRYKLLLKSGDKINNEKYFFDRTLGYTTSEAGVLVEILSIDDNLRIAYNLKEEYRMFNSVKESEYDKKKSDETFDDLITRMLTCEIREMVNEGKTLSNWKEEIKNSFTWIDGRRISNGCIEGKNSYIKKILSNANGMSNFKRARNRMMYSQNKHEKYVVSVHQAEIKKPGNSRGKYNKNNN